MPLGSAPQSPPPAPPLLLLVEEPASGVPPLLLLLLVEEPASGVPPLLLLLDDELLLLVEDDELGSFFCDGGSGFVGDSSCFTAGWLSPTSAVSAVPFAHARTTNDNAQPAPTIPSALRIAPTAMPCARPSSTRYVQARRPGDASCGLRAYYRHVGEPKRTRFLGVIASGIFCVCTSKPAAARRRARVTSIASGASIQPSRSPASQVSSS